MGLERTYRASELIERLQKLITEHGDLPVYADDPDTDYRMEIGLIYKPAKPEEEWPERFEIKIDYHGRPEGHFKE